MINSTYRSFTILVAVHVLAACGGGGGGGEMTPPVPTAEMAKITSQNAPTVAGVASEVVLEEGLLSEDEVAKALDVEAMTEGGLLK